MKKDVHEFVRTCRKSQIARTEENAWLIGTVDSYGTEMAVYFDELGRLTQLNAHTRGERIQLHPRQYES